MSPRPDDLRRDRRAARYTGGARGFSNSPRAGRYGTLGFTDHITTADASTSILAMIEDPIALDRLDDDFRVEGLTAPFIGRGDLSVALGAANAGPILRSRRRCGGCRRGRAARCSVAGACRSASGADVAWLGELGVTASSSRPIRGCCAKQRLPTGSIWRKLTV